MTVEYSREEKLKQKIEELIQINRDKVEERIERRKRRARELRFERYEVEERVNEEFGRSSDELDHSQDSTVVDSPFKPTPRKIQSSSTTCSHDMVA